MREYIVVIVLYLFYVKIRFVDSVLAMFVVRLNSMVGIGEFENFMLFVFLVFVLKLSEYVNVLWLMDFFVLKENFNVCLLLLKVKYIVFFFSSFATVFF